MVSKLFTISGFLLAMAVILSLAACAVVNQPRFGKLPEGDKLDRIKSSPNYKNGKFVNLIPTPKFSEDVGIVSILWNSFFDKNERLVPEFPIPVVKTDLKNLSENSVVWMGHSSWFIRINGINILIDPILSDYAAPFSFMNKAFKGTSIYEASDMPEIDYLIISHDHWDHLDYPAINALKSKVNKVICPLGVGSNFEYWGYPKDSILEMDWNEKVELKDLTVHVLPARHYSGRMFKENKTLWASFAFETKDLKIFYSGDSGYGPHFSEIGKAFKDFDFVMIDCGQYDSRWAYIHMTPEEAFKAAFDLGAKAFAPSHVGRFTIANHPWDEPFKRLKKSEMGNSVPLLTPMIGEKVVLDGKYRELSSWWKLNKIQTSEIPDK